MRLQFSGEIWFWKGPRRGTSSPCRTRSAAKTALFPKDGRYVVPVKAGVRKAEKIDVGETVIVRLSVDV